MEIRHVIDPQIARFRSVCCLNLLRAPVERLERRNLAI